MQKTQEKLRKIKTFRLKAHRSLEPKPIPENAIPVRRYRYRIIQTSIANGTVIQITEREAKRAVREAIEADGSVLFDSQSIQIELIPICMVCEKDCSLEELEPFAQCQTCSALVPLDELDFPKEMQEF